MHASRRRHVTIPALALLLCSALACFAIASSAGAAEPNAAAARDNAPERIYVNGRIWTGDREHPTAQAFAIAGGRFIAVGSEAEVRKLADATTEVVDLQGQRVVPGFNDSHWHLPARRSARLDNAGSVEVVQQRLIEYAHTLPATDWVVGRGWMPTDFPARTAHRRYLDAIFPDRPVVIRDRDGHQALANTRALELAKVDRTTPDPADGRIARDANGDPTGLLQEAAAGLVTQLLPELSVDDTYQLLLDELATAASLGLTSLQDATEGGLTDNERAALERAQADGKLLVHYRAAVPFDKDATPEEIAGYVAMRDRSRGQLLYYGLAKGMIDGTVDARTAYMLQPYVGGGTGLPMWSQADLDRVVAAYDRAGLQIGLHAIGDGAIRMALDAYENAARANGPRDRRHRVEHVEVPAAAEIPRFRALGVIAATQAIFATPDVVTLENYAPLVGPERATRAQPFRQFDDAGAVQSFGSDYPVYPMNPLLGIYTAVTRQLPDGTPAGGWHPANRIDVETALRHYTVDAAYASFDEQHKGTINPGKLADFVVLSRDILAVPPRELLEAKVLLTVMGGRETYEAPAPAVSGR